MEPLAHQWQWVFHFRGRVIDFQFNVLYELGAIHVRIVLFHHVAVQIVHREDGAAICESFPYRILPFVTVTLRDFERPHEGQILPPMGLGFSQEGCLRCDPSQ